MNNHQKSSFHPLGDFLNPALTLLRLGLRKSPIGQKLNFANHPYLSAREATHCKGLNLTQETKDMHKAIGLIGIISACQNEA